MTRAALPLVLPATVLSNQPRLQKWLPEVLGGHGFVTSAVSTPGELYRAVAAEPDGICVLDATRDGEQMLAIIARLRSASNIGIVALTEPEQAELRINALLIGADACAVTPVEPRELAAIMLGVARRIGRNRQPGELMRAAVLDAVAVAVDEREQGGMAPEPGAWELAEDDWKLVAPGGVTLELSQTERALLSALVDHSGRVLSREYLTVLLDRRGTRLPTDDREAYSAHRISMLVSRMRKKARQAGVRLPVRVVRGQGYELAEVVRRT